MFGEMRFGVVWLGYIAGIIRCCGSARLGMAYLGSVEHGWIWHGMTRIDNLCYHNSCVVRLGLAWRGLSRQGMDL